MENYFDRSYISKFKSFDEFLEEAEDEDLDLNLIFRWDWENSEVDCGDIYYRDGKLLLFYIGQRKGVFRTVSIEVCRADQEKIRVFLKERWEHLKLIWEGIS
jgi:hypothetical protein